MAAGHAGGVRLARFRGRVDIGAGQRLPGVDRDGIDEVVVDRWRCARDGAPVPMRAAASGGAFLLAAVSIALALGTFARNREYASAVSLARKVVERRPTSIGHHILGVELATAGYHKEAATHLREAIRDDSRAHLDFGTELFNSGKLDEAIEQLQAFAGTWRLPYRLVPRWLEPPENEVMQARNLMGRAFAMQRRWPQAIEQARLILTMAPANAEAEGLLAQSLFGQENYEEAIPHFREYLKARPNDQSVVSNLGIALVATGKNDEAIALFRHAVEVDPGNAQARTNLALALYDRRDVDGAAQHARESVRLKPDDPATRDLLGRALAVQGKLAEARAQFERALQIDPAYEEAREDLKRMSRLSGMQARPAP
jgi:tetratricopeptide (TPR) repeat protein